MVQVLRRSHGSGLLNDYPNLSAYVARGEARPAFKRAFDAQLAVFNSKSQLADNGFMLNPNGMNEVAVLAQPVEEKHAAVLALLADGEAWSSSSIALALGTSQRTVQRALDTLAAADKVQYFGRGRARRWLSPPLPGFATTLLLPHVLPGQ